jgi:hypothetical protein
VIAGVGAIWNMLEVPIDGGASLGYGLGAPFGTCWRFRSTEERPWDTVSGAPWNMLEVPNDGGTGRICHFGRQLEHRDVPVANGAAGEPVQRVSESWRHRGATVRYSQFRFSHD